jgi:hypothetical protein
MLSKWISNITGKNTEHACLKTIAMDDVEVRITKETRNCGHLGYWLELRLHSPDDCDWIPIGLMMDLDLQKVIDWLQEAVPFIAELSGVRQLPTVSLWGKRYFIDERLSELRNVEDPHERVKLVKVL